MAHFPERITPPQSVFEARAERQRHVMRSAFWAVALRLLIISAEFMGVAFFGSASLLMDALASLIDVFCSLCLIGFIRLAGRPPDETHPFGHGRFEPLAGFQLGLLLIVVGAGALVQQTFQLAKPVPGQLNGYIWLIPVGAVIALEISYSIAMRAAKKHNSPALQADAAHYRVDSLTSLFAAIALLLAAYLPEWSLLIDHIGAIGIALLMIILGGYSVMGNVNQLLDRAPSQEYFDTVYRAAKDVSGVLGTEKTRIQQYGPDAHVDIDIEVDPHLPVEEAHKISQHVRVAIQKAWPAVRDVTVHIEPFYPNDH